MKKYVEIEIQYLTDGTVQHKKFRGHSRSSQLWDGGRTLIKIFDKKGRCVTIWQGTNVQYILTKYKRR